GVVALDSDLRIRTANQASGAILNVDLENRAGEYLKNQGPERWIDICDRDHGILSKLRWAALTAHM
ncbi:MAG: hypothetical protein IH960_13145, partial [Chloroflexi bacterium]|nr:hypothetical protein [Chloroflexota bacterium]